MRATCCWWAVGCLLLACAWATADKPPDPPRPTGFLAQAAAPSAPSQPPAAGQPPAGTASDQQARADLNQQAEQDTAANNPSEEAPTGANPHMIGDLPGVFTLKTVAVPAVLTLRTTRTVTQTSLVNVPSFTTQLQTQIVTVTIEGSPFEVPVTVPVAVPTTATVPVTTTTRVPVRRQERVTVLETVRVPVPFAGGFKAAENEGPWPEDRVFVTYNFYSDVTGPPTAASAAHVDTVTTSSGGMPATLSTTVPGVAPPSFDVHREVLGFEKTFLGGVGSVGLRVPVLEQQGDDGITGDGFGDMTGLLKLALFRNVQAGDVVSAGLAVTAPTGRGIPTLTGELHSTILQPFVAWAWGQRRFYVQGFTSVAVPTDSRDVTLLFNDLGIGYVLYRGPAGQAVTAVAPTVEAHVTTPLDNRGAESLVTLQDLVVLTEGVHLDLYGRSTLTLAAATPVTGPKAFDLEALVQFNWRF
jgi:hypothetical protein